MSVQRMTKSCKACNKGARVIARMMVVDGHLRNRWCTCSLPIWIWRYWQMQNSGSAMEHLKWCHCWGIAIAFEAELVIWTSASHIAHVPEVVPVGTLQSAMANQSASKWAPTKGPQCRVCETSSANPRHQRHIPATSPLGWTAAPQCTSRHGWTKNFWGGGGLGVNFFDQKLS